MNVPLTPFSNNAISFNADTSLLSLRMLCCDGQEHWRINLSFICLNSIVLSNHPHFQPDSHVVKLFTDYVRTRQSEPFHDTTLLFWMLLLAHILIYGRQPFSVFAFSNYCSIHQFPIISGGVHLLSNARGMKHHFKSLTTSSVFELHFL